MIMNTKNHGMTARTTKCTILRSRSRTSQSRVRQIAALFNSTRLDGFEFSLCSPRDPIYVTSACFSGCRCPKVFARRQDISSGRPVAQSRDRPALKYWTALSCSRIFFLHLLHLRAHPGTAATFQPPTTPRYPPFRPCHPPSPATFFFSPGFLLFRSRPLPPLSNLLPPSSFFFSWRLLFGGRAPAFAQELHDLWLAY